MGKRNKDLPEKRTENFEDSSPFDQPVILPIEDSLDLHAFSPRDIPSVVRDYLDECRQAGFSEVRLIHGKGIGVQRNLVHAVLSQHLAVSSYHEAPTEAGGWGATIVVLKVIT